MSNENLAPPSVAEMLRLTGDNTSKFMLHVADHIDKLEQEVLKLQNRVKELESTQDDFK